MGSLSDRTVIVTLLCTLGLVFALVFWFGKLNPPRRLRCCGRRRRRRATLRAPGCSPVPPGH